MTPRTNLDDATAAARRAGGRWASLTLAVARVGTVLMTLGVLLVLAGVVTAFWSLGWGVALGILGVVGLVVGFKTYTLLV